MRLSASLQSLFKVLSNLDTFDFTLKATLVLFLFSGWIHGDEWYYFLPILILSAFGLLIPEYHGNKFLWYLLSAVFMIKTVHHWWVQDNHLFVNTYWTLAIAFALSFKHSRQILSDNARLMIGLIFLFATIWKFLSPDFTSGNYFHYTFLTDPRFAEESKLVGQLGQAQLTQNRNFIHEILEGNSQHATLHSSETLRKITYVVTWHTILIESILFILFLLPSKFNFTRYRNYVLLLFALTTYLTMPIHSFAWLLLAIGIAQTKPHEVMDRVLLIASLPIMLLFKFVPFMEWIANTH